MHLTIAAHDFYPDSGSGGTGRYVYETARRLVDRDVQVSVVTRRRGDVPTREVVDGIDIYRYDLSIADRSCVEIVPQLFDAVGAVADHMFTIEGDDPPDLLSFQGPVTSLLVDHVANDTVPRVVTFHSPWPTEYRIKTRGPEGCSGVRRRLNVAVRRRLERTVLARSDHLITLSEFMRSEFERVYGLDRDVSVIPGGIDTEQFSPAADPSHRIADEGPTFLTVRRLSGRMGHDLLLEAFASVVTHRPDARLFIAGDGPLRARLERRAAALGIATHVDFIGYVPDEDLPGVYASADVFVLPTIELEGFGLATLEALASGTPVIGTPVGGTVELLSELDSTPAIPETMLLPSVDVDALSERMLAWSALSEDELFAAGQACRRHVAERYTWEQTVTTLLGRYRAVCNG